MNKKLIIGSVGIAVLFVLTSLTTVVGFQDSSSSDETYVPTPLFTIRKNQFLNSEPTHTVQSQYLGQGNPVNFVLSRRSTLQASLNRVLRLIETTPHLLQNLLETIATLPAITTILSEYHINPEEFQAEMNRVGHNPLALKDTIEAVLQSSPGLNDPVPLGLSTSSALGCFIVALVLIPIMAAIGLIIATLTIITCLNIGGCFETLVGNLLESIVQGVKPPLLR